MKMKMKKPTPKSIQGIRDKLRPAVNKELSMTSGWRKRLAEDLRDIISDGNTISLNIFTELISSPLIQTGEPLIRTIAGNYELLQKNKNIPAWEGEEICLIVHCTDVFPGNWSYKGCSGFYTGIFDVMYGILSGTILHIGFPDWLYAKFATFATGRKYAKSFPYDIAGMSFTGWFEQEHSGCTLTEITPTANEASNNLKLQKARKKGCIKGIREDCDYCKLGRDSCYLSYHSHDFKWGECIHPKCDMGKGYISPKGMCTDCIEKGRFLPKKQQRKKL